MNDHIKSEIPAYLAGELPESRNRQIEAHAASCDKCRSALSKTRAKMARVKREALKKADAMPNLFLARQRKLSGLDTMSGNKTWILIILAVAVVGGYWAFHSKSAPSAAPAAEANTPAPAEAPPASVPLPPHQATEPKPTTPVESISPPVVMHVIQDWKGPDCGVTEGRRVVIRAADAWQQLWTEMALKDPLPPVDFDKQIVLGVFAGERPAGSSVQLGRIEATDDEVMAPYRVLAAAVAAPPAVQTSTDAAPAAAPLAPPAPGHPYVLAVIQRVDKKIHLMQREKRS